MVDGISTTGVGVDAIGTNWREALAVAMRHLRGKGHARIGFLTSNHPARPISMARQEYLRQAEQMPGGGWLIALDALPGEVVGGACIIDRSNGRADVGCKLISLAAVDFPDYDANDLPPDLAAMEAVKPGSRGLA